MIVVHSAAISRDVLGSKVMEVVGSCEGLISIADGVRSITTNKITVVSTGTLDCRHNLKVKPRMTSANGELTKKIMET